MPTPPYEVVIIGAGIIGLAHAYTAIQQGNRVLVIDRDARANGASIRNFGHACFSAQSARLMDLTWVAREGLLKAAATVGFAAQECGTVVVARTDAEMAVLKQLCAAQPLSVELLDELQVHQRLGGLTPEVPGGAYLPLDVRVDPRTLLAQLADWVATHPAGEVQWSTSLQQITSDGDHQVVHTSRGPLWAERVLVCVGHDVDYLYPELAADAEVTRCRLNMARVVLPQSVVLEPAVLTSTSIARYPAFTEMPAAPELIHQLHHRAPQLLDVVANVMCTQAADGTLIVGDTHHYGQVAPPFMTEADTDVVLADLADALGVSGFKVVERWQGVYANSPRQNVLRANPVPGVELVTVTTGVGMTLAFGLAHNTFTEGQQATE